MSSNAALVKRDEFVNAHLSLVDRIVAPLSLSLPRGCALDGEDLRQEGRIGLMRAAETFDDAKGASFQTWATTCISSAVRTALREAGVINETDLDDAGLLSTPDETPAADARLTIEQLMPQLAARDHRQAEAVSLHFLQGLKKSEVARKMQISAMQAGRLINSGLTQLRAMATA